MLKYKRIIAVIIAMMIIVGSTPMSLATSEVKTDKVYTNALYLLDALEVSSYFNIQNRITYHSFNDVLNIALDGKALYLDIKELTGLNYSTETGTDEITYIDAIKSLVSLTGYKALAEVSGGTNAAYLSIAKTNGILSGVSIDINPNVKVNARDAAVMIYNALNTDMMQSNYKGPSVEYNTNKGETVLYIFRGIRKGNGIVQENEYTGLHTSSGCPKDMVKINDVLYNDTQECAADFIGYEVEFYYYDNDNERLTLFEAHIDDENNEEILIDDNFSKNIGRCIYYLDGESESYTDIPADAAILYNGVALYEYNDTIFNFTNKEARLVDNNRDGEIDIVLIREHTDWVIAGVSLEHGLIFDSITGNEINVNDNIHERIRIYNTEGKLVTYYALEKYDVASVYRSKNDSLIDMYICKRQITGIIESKWESDNRSYVTISGETYELSQTCIKFNGENMVLGRSGVFYLNKKSEITFVKDIDENLKYGYVIAGEMKPGSLNSKVHVKILSEDGDMYVYALKNIVKIDGNTYNDANNALQAVGCRKLIRYDVTENNEIYVIDTDTKTENESDETLLSFGSAKSLKYATTSKTFEGKIITDENTLVFFCPSDPDLQSDEYYDVTDNTYLVTGITYKVQAFSISQKNYIPNAIVIDASMNNYKKVRNRSKSYLISDIRKVLSNDGDEVYKLSVFDQTTERTFICSDQSVGVNENLQVGDVINAAIDAKGRFSDIVKVYDSQKHELIKGEVINSFAGTSFDSVCKMSAGYVYYNNGSIMGISEVAPDSLDVPSRSDLYYVRIHDYLGVIIDSNYHKDDERHIRRLTTTDIKDCLNYTNCARVFVRQNHVSTAFVVVYQ